MPARKTWALPGKAVPVEVLLRGAATGDPGPRRSSGTGRPGQTPAREPRIIAGSGRPASPWRGCEANQTSIQLDLHVHAGGQLEFHEGIDGFVRRIKNVHQALVRAQLVLVARVLIDMG